MRREKQKGKSDTAAAAEDIEEASDDMDDSENTSTDGKVTSSTAVNAPQEPTIDDDGQSHNIDNAVQYENDPPSQYNGNNDHLSTSENYSSSSTLSIPTTKYTTTTTNSNVVGVQQHHRQLSSISGPSNIEFEKIEVVEIKSDGTTGHLTPRQYQN